MLPGSSDAHRHGGGGTAQEPRTPRHRRPQRTRPPRRRRRGAEPVSLDELLDLVKTGFRREREANQEREARFVQAKEEQAELLQEIQDRVAAEEARSERLETTFAANEISLAQLEDNLEQRLGTMGELFGVVRQVAGDMQAHVWESVTSSQLPIARNSSRSSAAARSSRRPTISRSSGSSSNAR